MKTINKLLITGFLICLFVLLSQTISPLSAYAAINCSNGNCFYTICNSNSDCNINRFTEYQFCQGNNLYQNYVINTCNNPGTPTSNCTSLKSPQLLKVCNQKCEDSVWYIGCSEGRNIISNSTNGINNTICNSNAYKKCSGNYLYWFDSCGKQGGVYQICSSGQTCSDNNCQTNQTIINYNSRAIKGCINNIVYWYDSFGNQQDISQNCGVLGQICQNGQCIKSQTPAYVQPALTVTKIIQTTTSPAPLLVAKTTNINCDISLQDYIKHCSNVESTQAESDQTKSNQTESTLTAAVSENPISSFLKKWYIWAIIIAVLIFLFIIIFRKLSSNV